MKKKIILVLFALIIMLTLCIIASADDYTEWTISEDGETLMVGNDTYELYKGYMYPTDRFLPEISYVYENRVNYDYLKKNYEDDGIMVLSSYSDSLRYIYVNNEGRAALNQFLNGKYSSYKIYEGQRIVSAPSSWINLLDGGSIVTVDVRDLKYCETYEVLGYDSTGTIAHTVGAIYADDTSYYYVNYDKLSNNYFDANGYFSYRQGTVKAYKLNATQSLDVQEYINNFHALDTIYETDKDDSFDGFGKGFYVFIFVFVTVLFGFVIPLVPVIIGAIRVVKGKTRNPKRWYLLFIGCALWILLTICILLAIIF